MDDLRDVMSDGFAAPLGDVIASVGRGVAEAQAALDAASLAQTTALYFADGEEASSALRDIGYRPTFYVLPETVCEVQVSMRIGGTGAADGSAGAAPSLPSLSAPGPAALMKARSYVTPIDAGFASRFGFQGQATAKLTFKIVPVPPPLALDERIVPDLAGRLASEAVAALNAVGLRAEVDDAQGRAVSASNLASSSIARQEPEAGAVLPFGAVVRLVIAGDPDER